MENDTKTYTACKNRILNSITNLDRKVIYFLKHWSSLIAAVIGLFLCIWSIVSGEYTLVIEVLLTGAIGYSIGFTAAIIGDLALLCFQMFEPNRQPNIAMNLLQFLSCAYIAWLGFKHHQLVRLNQKQIENKKPEHASHVIPWVLVNEVRNSLLAMRLLLFQQANRQDKMGVDQEFKLVQDELLRLELIFGALSKYEENQQQSQ